MIATKPSPHPADSVLYSGINSFSKDDDFVVVLFSFFFSDDDVVVAGPSLSSSSSSPPLGDVVEFFLVFLLILASLDRNELTLALFPLLLVNPFESTREDDEEEEVTSGSRIAAVVVVVLLVRIVRFTVGLLLLSVDVFLPVVVVILFGSALLP